MRWSIGNGQKVQIWADRWLPTPHSFKVISPKPQVFEGEMVESLLDQYEGGRDKNLVRSVFIPHEAETILSIPISLSLPEDALTWAWTPNGRFTVSNAYKVACSWLCERSNKGETCEGSDPGKGRKFWKFLWQLQCPSKIKQFL